MALFTRTALTVESPDPSQGGGAAAISGANSDGFDDGVSVSSSGGGPTDTERKTGRWRDFGAQIANVVKIELKYNFDWNWDAVADLGDEGSCSSILSFFFADLGDSGGAGPLNGPGGGHDENSDSDIGSATITLPNNTDLANFQVQCEMFAEAESGISGSSGSADASVNMIITNLRIEITTAPPAVIFGVM